METSMTEMSSMEVRFGEIRTVHAQHWPQHCWVPIWKTTTILKKMILMKMTVLFRAIHRLGIHAQRICQGMDIYRVVVLIRNLATIRNHIHSKIAREHRTMVHNMAIDRFRWVRIRMDGHSTIHIIRIIMGHRLKWAANSKPFDVQKMVNRTWS